MESSKQNAWTKEYIETFTVLKIEQARPLIYKSIYDWFGLNEDFAINSQLFEIKKQMEDSIKAVFSNKLEKNGYKLNHCIAFIDNTAKIIKGEKPIAKYLIEVTIPTTEDGSEHQEKIGNALKLKKEDVFIRYENGWYHIEKQDRFDEGISSTPIYSFLSYAKEIPNPNDLVFLQRLLDNNFIGDNYYPKRIREAIDEIKGKLKQIKEGSLRPVR